MKWIVAPARRRATSDNYLLTGRLRLCNGTPQDKVRRHQWEAPVRVERLGLLGVLGGGGRAVHKLLAKDPAARSWSAAELAAELEPFAAAAARAARDGVVSFDLPSLPAGAGSSLAAGS